MFNASEYAEILKAVLLMNIREYEESGHNLSSYECGVRDGLMAAVLKIDASASFGNNKRGLLETVAPFFV